MRGGIQNLGNEKEYNEVVNSLGGEALLRKKYPELYKIIQYSKEMQQRKSGISKHTQPVHADNDLIGLQDSVDLRYILYSQDCGVDAAAGMWRKAVSPSLMIIGSLYDKTHDKYLDGYSKFTLNETHFEQELKRSAADLLLDKEYVFSVKAEFRYIVIDDDGNPQLFSEWRETEEKKEPSRADIVKSMEVKHPMPIKHPNADVTTIYYQRGSSVADYSYNDVSVGDYEFEVTLPYEGAVTFADGIIPVSVDLNDAFVNYLENIGGGMARFNPAYFKDIAFNFAGSTMFWKFPDCWHNRLCTDVFHADNHVDFYSHMNVVTNFGKIPIVVSSTQIDHDDPSYKRINKLNFCWGCFAAGTQIRMADGTQKDIRDIRIGDVVRTETGTDTVTELITGKDKRLVVIETADGRCVRVTEGHPMKAERGWLAARDLNAADILYTEDGLRPIRFLYMEEAQTEVFSIRLSAADCVYAEGILAGDFKKQNNMKDEDDRKAGKPLEEYQQEIEDLFNELDKKMRGKIDD